MARFLSTRSVVSVSAVVSVCAVVVSALLPSTALGVVAATQEDLQVPVADNVRLAQVLAPVFEQLLRSSPAFREQCARIARTPYLRVNVIAVMASSTTSRGSARTTMRRYSAGPLVATVEIPGPLIIAEYAELFGHEFEHVIEQIDRVNLEQLVETGGAARLADGAYETTRARSAGLVIADETERALSPRASSSGGGHPLVRAGAGTAAAGVLPQAKQQ